MFSQHIHTFRILMLILTRARVVKYNIEAVKLRMFNVKSQWCYDVGISGQMSISTGK